MAISQKSFLVKKSKNPMFSGKKIFFFLRKTGGFFLLSNILKKAQKKVAFLARKIFAFLARKKTSGLA